MTSTLLLTAALMFTAVAAQTPNPLKITPIAPETFRLDWQADNQRTYVVEASPELTSWVGLGKPVIGTGTARSLLFSSPEPKFFFRLRQGAVRPGFDAVPLEANDDGSTLQLSLPFTINFLGHDYVNCYVNNNGNITFFRALSTFTPADLRSLESQIIAACWADVDTRSSGSNLTRYSRSPGTPGFVQEFVDGRRAFGATYNDVGYFSNRSDKLNSFQIILIERTDTGSKNFDVEFNYNKIQWETGDASNGSEGFGGSPARAGISGRRANPNANEKSSLEISGSGISKAFLDTEIDTGLPNTDSGLIYRNWNSSVPGRFVFQFRGGILQGAIRVEAGPDITLSRTAPFSTNLMGLVSTVGGTTLTRLWSQTEGEPATISNSGSLTPVVSLPGPGHYSFRLTANTSTIPSFSASDEVLVVHEDEVLEVNAGDPVFLEIDDPLTFILSGQATFTSSGSVTVNWSQSFGDQATIGNPTSLQTSVTLPGPGDYSFVLTANATHNNRSYVQSSEVFVSHADYALDVYAGDPIIRESTDSFIVTLAGQATFSGDGPLTTNWTQSSGDAATISNPAILNPQITLPGHGSYGFDLTATTSSNPPRSSTSTVIIEHITP